MKMLERLASVVRPLSLPIPTQRFECSTSGNADDFLPRRTPSNYRAISLPKPSWVVRTESNVRKWKRKTPEPSCVVCQGSGRVDCHHCNGKGRTNHVHAVMLPKGEWPKWCKTCGGSGLACCSRCLGTGEYRDVMGFRFMKMEARQTGDHKRHPTQWNQEQLTAADLLLSHSSQPQQEVQ
ncbi:hypothetical protein Ancab_037286 [Ancistrocladus abbreviatus]